MLTFKIYQKKSERRYVELGTVLNESTLIKIASRATADELKFLFVEVYKDDDNINSEKGLYPLMSWS